MKVMCLALCLFSSVLSWAETPNTREPSMVDFKADFHQRDLKTNSAIGKGNVWIKRLEKQLWADEVEFDFNTHRAIATGKVTINEGDVKIKASYAQYEFKGESATLEDAELTVNQMVVTGARIKKIGRNQFEVEDGFYSNCHFIDDDGKACDLDLKVYGKRISVTLEEYAHVHDVIFYLKGVPVLYFPYFIFPVKSQRQTGFLSPQLVFSERIGSSFTLPFFWNLGPWHDLTIVPTIATKQGYHFTANYQYRYSSDTEGSLMISFVKQRFGAFPNPDSDDGSRPRTLGFIGDGAILARNRIQLGDRSHSRQTIRWVSHPFYTRDNSLDIPGSENAAHLRSLWTATFPYDQFFLGGRLAYFQSLVLSNDTGVDEGAPLEAPTVLFSARSTPLLGNFLFFEADADFRNFFRKRSFDQVPTTPSTTGGVQSDGDPTFDANDYLRTGRRLKLEPRIFANLSPLNGIQIQPLVRFGSLFYHFNIPDSTLLDRYYANLEVPFSFYLTKRFALDTDRAIHHIIQPRLIYAKNLFLSDEPNHPFFKSSGPLVSNPRFDSTDFPFKFDYLRVELIQRLLKSTGNDLSRFFLLQVSSQWNFRTNDADARFKNRFGPLEILSELSVWRLSGQLQVLYPFEFTQGVRETTISGSLNYFSPEGDVITLSSHFQTRPPPAPNEKIASLSFLKKLPTFFDLRGAAEYTLVRNRFLGYSLGVIISRKPTSCWSLNLTAGRDSLQKAYVLTSFQFNFGTPQSAAQTAASN